MVEFIIDTDRSEIRCGEQGTELFRERIVMNDIHPFNIIFFRNAADIGHSGYPGERFPTHDMERVDIRTRPPRDTGDTHHRNTEKIPQRIPWILDQPFLLHHIRFFGPDDHRIAGEHHAPFDPHERRDTLIRSEKYFRVSIREIHLELATGDEIARLPFHGFTHGVLHAGRKLRELEESEGEDRDHDDRRHE